MSKKPVQKSSEEQIQTLTGTAAIRKRPGMYIGALGTQGVKRLVIEAIGNVLDLYAEQSADNLMLSVNEKTGEIVVADNGYGMPVAKIHDIMMVTHTSGKFSDNGFSIGMNGVGNKCINALSEKCSVNVKRDGYRWQMKFAKGQPTTELLQLEETNETGTTISFIPDKEILGDFEIPTTELMELLQQLSYLSKGLTIQFHAKTKDNKTLNKIFKSENGHIDYINEIEKAPLLKKPIYIEDKTDNKQVFIAINYSTKRDEDMILSFVNNMSTTEHGTHVQGLKMALTQVIKKYITDNDILTKKDAKLEITGEDVIEGISVVIELKWIEPMFDSQTKDRLTSSEASGYVRKVIGDQLTYYLNKNKADAKAICNKIIMNAKGRAASKRAKTLTKKRETGFTSISSLSKFTKASSKDAEKLELFIVEGNSAGGSCAQGRDTEFQAVYRLRGKPLNTTDLHAAKVVANKEFNDIVNILGTGIDVGFDIEKLTHHNIIIMSDADVDGSHICALMITFFFKHMRKLIESGHVYCALPPLYKIRENGKDIYITDRKDYNNFISNKIIGNYAIGGFKTNGKPVQFPEEIVVELLNRTSKYTYKMDNVASKLATEPELIELIAVNKDKTYEELSALITKQYPFIECEETQGGLFVDGLIDGNYQSLLVNDMLFLDMKPILDILDDLSFKNFIVKGPKDAKARQISLYSLLKEVYDYATPAKMTRYKGLTKN